jgi:hypothetical protein
MSKKNHTSPPQKPFVEAKQRTMETQNAFASTPCRTSSPQNAFASTHRRFSSPQRRTSSTKNAFSCPQLRTSYPQIAFAQAKPAASQAGGWPECSRGYHPRMPAEYESAQVAWMPPSSPGGQAGGARLRRALIPGPHQEPPHPPPVSLLGALAQMPETADLAKLLAQARLGIGNEPLPGATGGCGNCRINI